MAFQVLDRWQGVLQSLLQGLGVWKWRRLRFGATQQISSSSATCSICKVSTKSSLIRFASVSMSQSVTDGELRMAFFLAEHRLPLAASEHLNQLFSKVCPDSAIAQRLSARARTRARAAIDVIAGSFHQHLVERMKTQPFSVVVDESCDVAVVEQVAFAVRLAGTTFYVHRNSLYSYP